jgi:protoheme IX farnesyltransferase
MPHFYAISIYRLRDYAAAGIPVLPVKKGVLRTKWNMLFYTIAFLIAVSLLTVFGYTGITYLIVMSTVGFFWLHKHIAGFWATDNDRWARSAFKSSLIILPLFALLLFANVVLP